METSVLGLLYKVCAFNAERASEPYVDSTSGATGKNTRTRTHTVAAYEKCKQVKSLLLVLDIFFNDVDRALVFGTLR